MIKSISTIGVHVSDQDKAKDFYVNRMGFEVIRDDATTMPGYRWLQVAPKGAQTSIVLEKSDGSKPLGQFSGMVLLTDDVNTTYNELSANGVDFSQVPTEQPYGIEAQFADQDGNGFILIQLPTQG